MIDPVYLVYMYDWPCWSGIHVWMTLFIRYMIAPFYSVHDFANFGSRDNIWPNMTPAKSNEAWYQIILTGPVSLQDSYQNLISPYDHYTDKQV